MDCEGQEADTRPGLRQGSRHGGALESEAALSFYSVIERRGLQPGAHAAVAFPLGLRSMALERNPVPGLALTPRIFGGIHGPCTLSHSRNGRGLDNRVRWPGAKQLRYQGSGLRGGRRRGIPCFAPGPRNYRDRTRKRSRRHGYRRQGRLMKRTIPASKAASGPTGKPTSRGRES